MDGWLLWIVLLATTLNDVEGADDSYNTIQKDGSYEFGYNNPDSYHYADANRNNVVKGEFGGRNPGTGALDRTVYTAGPRGYRPQGKNIVRKYDLSQSGPRPIGSPDDPYYDPYEDPSYNFSFRTRAYNRQENANRAGDVSGKYSYLDDVGERHNVEFIAGKNTGFHVKTPFPDSNPRAYGPLYFNGRGKPIPRGRTSIQRGLDGSYRFVSAGPDQRRTETSDATGHVRGSYTYLDDKGVQHSVHYIAGPETGYRVLKTVKGPHLPTVFPFGRPEIIPSDFYDYGKEGDLFDTAASGHIKPGSNKPSSKEDSIDSGKDKSQDEFTFGNKKPTRPGSRPPTVFGGGSPTFGRPTYTDEDTEDFGDLFGEGSTSSGGTGSGGGGFSTTSRPSRPVSKPSRPISKPSRPISKPSRPISSKPSRPTAIPRPTKPEVSSEDDGSYKPSLDDDGTYNPAPTKPSFGNLPRPGGFGTTIGTPTISSTTKKPSVISSGAGGADLEEGYGADKPSVGFEEGSNEVNEGDFGLFGSESNNARPPYSDNKPIKRPIIQVGGTNESCKKCPGTIVTNVGDKPFNVPPGVSVRAHVQAIDLLPISPSVPSPSEQYKFDTSVRTEQLNEASNQIVSTNSTEQESENSSLEMTTLLPDT